MNWLLIFIPITLVLEHLGLPPTLLFFSAAISIVPIAAMIVRATEQVASRTGEAVGGLLNATFGNAPELIICLVALKAGYLEMVRAALIGLVPLALGNLSGQWFDRYLDPARFRRVVMLFIIATGIALFF